MAYEQTPQPADPKPTTTPAPVVEPAAPAPAGGYDAQRASLKPPAPGATTAAATTDSPKFDMWKLSPEVQAKFIELGKLADPKKIEALVNDLVKKDLVPKDVVQGVIESNKGFFSKTYGAIKSGSWHTVATNDKGQVTHDFKIDGKGLGWETETWKLTGDFKDKSATYTDKKDDWSAKAAYDDRGSVAVTTGLDPNKDSKTYKVEGGKDGGGASYTQKVGDTTTTASGDVTVKDGQGTATLGYNKAQKDGESTAVTAKGKWGTQVGGDVAYTTKNGDKATTATAGVTNQDGQTTGTAGYTRKNGDKSTTIDGSVDVGKKDGVALHYANTDGKKTTDIKGSVAAQNGTTTVAGAITRGEEGKTTSATAEVYAGEKNGGKLTAAVDRPGYKADGSVDATQTSKDGTTTTEAGGSASYTKKALKKPGEEKASGDDVTVTVNARGKQVKEAAGNESTNVKLGGGIKSGDASANAQYETEGGTKDGTSYRFHDITTSFGNTWDLDQKAKEGFKLNLNGHLRLSEAKGDDVVATGDLTGSWYKGEGDGKKEFNFRLYGGQDKLPAFGSLAYTTPGMLGKDEGSGQFGHAAGTYKSGKYSLTGDATLGQTDQTTLGGAHLGASKDEAWKIDAYASFAKQDAGTASLFKLNSEFALKKDLKLGVGGSYAFTPGSAEHQKLWEIHTTLGYDIKKDQHLTLKMGVAGDGQQVYFVPEAMYTIDKKLSVGAMAAIGRNGSNTVGAKLTHEQSGITLFGGYGNASNMMNPYAGNGGMNMPGMDQKDVMGRGGPSGGFVGVQWNALPTIMKIFGK